jgi:hypothetical protein
MAKWYAVMADREDSDWGYGSHDLSEAKQMLKDAEYEDGYIAVIENDVCIEELTQEQLFDEPLYMNTDTGETFTHDELVTIWNQFKDEMEYKDFDDFLENAVEEVR